MAGTVYLFWAEGTSIFKIGFTKRTPDERANEIEAYSPLPIRIVAEMKASAKTEAKLHRHFSAFRTHGEWFNLPEKAVWKLLKFFGVEAPQMVNSLVKIDS